VAAIEATFTATVWRYAGDSSWHFLTLPTDLGDEIRSRVEPVGFGSVRVTASVGATTWATSVFPDRGSGSYVLPVKVAVRRAEGLDDGTEVVVTVSAEV
jgi:hypothetical protein